MALALAPASSSARLQGQSGPQGLRLRSWRGHFPNEELLAGRPRLRGCAATLSASSSASPGGQAGSEGVCRTQGKGLRAIAHFCARPQRASGAHLSTPGCRLEQVVHRSYLRAQKCTVATAQPIEVRQTPCAARSACRAPTADAGCDRGVGSDALVRRRLKFGSTLGSCDPGPPSLA